MSSRSRSACCTTRPKRASATRSSTACSATSASTGAQKPLTSRQTVIDLIAATTTSTRLKVYARVDENTYPKGIKVTDAELAAVNLTGDAFHPEWNYTIIPSVINT